MENVVAVGSVSHGSRVTRDIPHLHGISETIERSSSKSCRTSDSTDSTLDVDVIDDTFDTHPYG